MKHLVLFIATLLIALHGNAQQRGAWARLTTPAKPMHLAADNSDRGSAPANDDCANAQVITVAADCSTPITGTNAGSSQDGGTPSCDLPGTYVDVWYVFDPGNTDTVSINLTPADANAQDWNFGLYDACGGNETYCTINPAAPQNVPVIPNTNNWLRVWANTAYAPGGDFTLCLTQQDNTPVPPNDLCTGAVPQTLALGSTITFTGTNVGALDNDNEGVPAVWEAFTTTECADIHIDLCGTTPYYQFFLFRLYDSCPGGFSYLPGSYTFCGTDSNKVACYAHLPAGTYYKTIGLLPGSIGPYTMHVSAVACGTEQASNDECDGALPLNVGATCDPQTFSPSCASQSMPGMTCNGSTGDANDDVWYSFTATQSDMSIGVLPSSNGNMDPAIQVFSGGCQSIVPFDCADVNGQNASEDLQMTGLVAGDTYYIRVYDFRSQYSYLDPSYELCVVEGLGSGVGLDEEEGTGNGSIYPNPNDGVFTIRLKNTSKAVQVDVIDAAGRTVSRTTPITSSGRVQVDASQLPQGAYVVRYTDGAHLLNERLIIQ